MNKLVSYLLSFLIVSNLIQISSEVKAIPAFARKTGFSCLACHSPYFPRLNKFGWAFKENGFQLPDNDDIVSEKNASKPESNLEILNNLPMAFRITSGVELKPSHKQIDFKLPSEVELISGGRIYKNVSFFLNQGFGTPFAPPPPMETVFLQVNNIFTSDNSFNFRAGKFFLMDWYFSSMRSFTNAPYLIQEANIGLNNFNLTSSQIGVEVYGRPLKGPVFYHFGVINGNYDETLADPESFDNNNYKDLFGGIKINLFENNSLGFFGYYGNNTVVNQPFEKKGLSLKAENSAAPLSNTKTDIPYFSLGSAMHFDLDPIPFQLLFMGAYSSNLDKQQDSTLGGFTELTYSFTPNLWNFETTITPLIRYDIVSSKVNNKNILESSITPSIQFLLLRNFVVSLEYSISLNDRDKDSGMLRIHTAL